LYRHAWNAAGRLRLQVSLRERPTLPVVAMAMKAQGYFSQLEFDLFDVRSLHAIAKLRGGDYEWEDLHRLGAEWDASEG